MTAAPDGAEPRVVIGLGASAGGVEALTALVCELPPDLQAAVFVVLHISPSGTSALAQILDRAGPLPAVTAVDGATVAAGFIYVASPDRHLLLEDGVIRLSAGPRENGHRPAVDPLLRSLGAYGTGAVGVILSGTRDDGTQGLARIKVAGGVALVQDPDESLYDGMIRNAMGAVDVDAVAPVKRLAAILASISEGGDPMSRTSRHAESPDPQKSDTRYTCPDCGGHISREKDGELIRFTCEIGHAFSPESLDGEQGTAVESALWTAVRLLGDRSALLGEMAERALGRGQDRSAQGFREQAREADAAGRIIRETLEEGRVPTAGGVSAG